jgi:peptide/nickel transport system ATP-binding protein
VSSAVLSVRDLCVEYGDGASRVQAVDHVSFELQPGEVLGLAGESGSGKSTIAQALLRVLPAGARITGGSIQLGGTDVLALDAEGLRRFRFSQASIVFQSAMNALAPVLRIGEQITDVILAHEDVSRTAARLRAGRLLELVGIPAARLDAYPHELSGGMRQRVVIAIALALSPPLLILDEPTTALDVLVQREILQKLAELRERLGFSILFITHDLALLLELATRIAVLYAGRVVENAPARDLLLAPLHPYTQGLLHSFPSLDSRKLPEGIPGAPPDMRQPPSGCRFHPRCEHAQPLCGRESPSLRTLAPGRLCACHFA